MSLASGDEDEAPTTGKPKQTFLLNFQEFLDGKELCPARNFKEMDKTKSTQHKILDNKYLKHFRMEDIISYITVQSKFALYEPIRSPKSLKKKAPARLKPNNLRLAHHYCGLWYAYFSPTLSFL